MGGLKLGPDKAANSSNKQWSVIRKLLMEASPEMARNWQAVVDSSGLGYDNAIKYMQGAGSTAKRNASIAGKQAMGAGTEGAISRGLYGSSYLTGLRGSVMGQTARTRAGIDEGTATMIAQLLQGKGNAQTAALGQKAAGMQGWNLGQAGTLMGWNNKTYGDNRMSVGDAANTGLALFGL